MSWSDWTSAAFGEVNVLINIMMTTTTLWLCMRQALSHATDPLPSHLFVAPCRNWLSEWWWAYHSQLLGKLVCQLTRGFEYVSFLALNMIVYFHTYPKPACFTLRGWSDAHIMQFIYVCVCFIFFPPSFFCLHALNKSSNSYFICFDCVWIFLLLLYFLFSVHVYCQ